MCVLLILLWQRLPEQENTKKGIRQRNHLPLCRPGKGATLVPCAGTLFCPTKAIYWMKQ